MYSWFWAMSRNNWKARTSPRFFCHFWKCSKIAEFWHDRELRFTWETLLKVFSTGLLFVFEKQCMPNKTHCLENLRGFLHTQYLEIEANLHISGKTMWHCFKYLNKTACKIWSGLDKVHFWWKFPNCPFFHRAPQIHEAGPLLWQTEPILYYNKPTRTFVISQSLLSMSLLNSQSRGSKYRADWLTD